MILSNIRQRTGDLKYGRQEIASLALQALAEVANPKILDLGASRGEDLSNIKELYDKECDLFGVECLPESVRHLNKLGIEATSVDLESEQLPYASATFDLVVSNQTYEHLKNIFWCTSEVCRVLKPGGYFLIGVPNLASFHCSLPLLLARQPRQIKAHGPHVRGFTIAGVKDLLLSDEYFDFIKMKGSGFYPLPQKGAKIAARLLPIYAVSIFCLFRRTGKGGSFIENFKSNYHYETSYFLG